MIGELADIVKEMRSGVCDYTVSGGYSDETDNNRFFQ